MSTDTLDELRLLRSRDACEALAVSRRQLDRMVKTGAIPVVRLTEPGHRRFRLTDLTAIVAATKEEEDQ